MKGLTTPKVLTTFERAWSFVLLYCPLMSCKSIAGFSPNILFVNIHLYTWVESGTVRVMSLAQENNTMTLAGLEPRPLEPGPAHYTPGHHVLFLHLSGTFQIATSFSRINIKTLVRK